MATSELTLKLTWENGVEFKMTSKHGSEAAKSVIQMDENGKLAELWQHVQTICEVYVRKELETIGREMKT